MIKYHILYDHLIVFQFKKIRRFLSKIYNGECAILDNFNI